MAAAPAALHCVMHSDTRLSNLVRVSKVADSLLDIHGLLRAFPMQQLLIEMTAPCLLFYCTVSVALLIEFLSTVPLPSALAHCTLANLILCSVCCPLLRCRCQVPKRHFGPMGVCEYQWTTNSRSAERSEADRQGNSFLSRDVHPVSSITLSP